MLVPTMLRDGDELGSFPGHRVDDDRDLSKLYRLSPQVIVESQPGGVWESEAIEGDGGLLERSGSQTRDVINGRARWRIDRHTVFLLPEGGPRPPVPGGQPQPSSGGGAAGLGFLGLLLAGLYFIGD